MRLYFDVFRTRMVKSVKLVLLFAFSLVGFGHTQKSTCPMEAGYCAKQNGRDQNSGVVKLNSSPNRNKCLKQCRNYAGSTGCEIIWEKANRGCYVHTRAVARGNKKVKHFCWVFSKCTKKGTGVHPCWQRISPCMNSGKCSPNGVGYTCVCPEGFSGTNCELTPPIQPVERPAPVAVGTHIVCRSLNKVITLRQGQGGYFYLRMVMKDSTDPYQLWDVKELNGGGWGYIYNKENGYVMDVLMAVRAAGTKVIAYPKNVRLTNGNQQWRFENGHIVSRLNNLALEADDYVIMAGKRNAERQVWTYEDQYAAERPQGAHPQCVFPFVYEGRTYHDCATVNNNGIRWCSSLQNLPRSIERQGVNWWNCDYGYMGVPRHNYGSGIVNHLGAKANAIVNHL